MPTEYDNDLLREGIFHYRVKEFDIARNYIERALENSDDMQTRAQANYYLSLLTDDPLQKRKYLEDTLAIDMTHAEARRALAVLDGKLKAKDIVNPDRMPAPDTGTITVQADRFTCPKCGGRMVYAPDGVSLICEYCSRNQRLSTTSSSGEQDFIVAMADGSGLRSPVAVQTFKCQGCGATFILAPEEISATCAYCGSVHVVALEEKQQMVEPDSILPMAFDQKQATWHLVHWVEGSKITPQEQVQPPRGLYLPTWTFDIIGSMPWNGMVFRNKREVPVSGTKEINFNDVRILGSKKLANLMVKTLPEFDLSCATKYDARFLAGWMADVYDLPMADASLEARRISVEHLRKMIIQEFGYIQNLGYSSSGIMVSAFKLILVPIWVTEIKAHDRTGRVLINGRTGSVHSEIQARGLEGWLETMLGV
jgi:Zn finger protein HypA/HybF involved in hydrogenase expression